MSRIWAYKKLMIVTFKCRPRKQKKLKDAKRKNHHKKEGKRERNSVPMQSCSGSCLPQPNLLAFSPHK